MKIIPVIKSAVDDSALRAVYQQTTGNILGGRSTGLQDPVLRAISTVGEFAGVKLVENNGALLRHAFFSCTCLLTIDLILEIQESSRLAILQQQTKAIGVLLCLISGNLQDWRNAVLDGCSPHASDNFRSFAIAAYKELKSAGLGPIWSDCRTTGDLVKRI